MVCGKMAKVLMMTVMSAVLIQDIHCSTEVCRNAVAPASKPRGVNKVDRASGKPLFQLHITPFENDKSKYKISVSIEEGKSFRFSEATLAVSTNDICGSGDFRFASDDFVDVVQDHVTACPRLIQTKKKTHMTDLLPLEWEAPNCGCVQFRILIVQSGEVYYAENPDVTEGPLAKMICVERKQSTTISRDQRLESLCHVIDKHSSSEIVSRSQFLKQRDLEVHRMDHLGIEMALELRRHDAVTCCKMEIYNDRMKCFDDARRRRIDRFCEDGTSDIPFRSFRRKHMKNLEQSCCWVLGEFRYMCFAKNSEVAVVNADATIFDHSMDASDVANDLADFGSHEHLDDFLKPRQFGNTFSNVDDEEEDDGDGDTDDMGEVEGNDNDDGVYDDEDDDDDEKDGHEFETTQKSENEMRVKTRSKSSSPQRSSHKEIHRKVDFSKTKSHTSQIASPNPYEPDTSTRERSATGEETRLQRKKHPRRRNSHEVFEYSNTHRYRAPRRDSPLQGRKGSAERRGRMTKAQRRRGTSRETRNKFYRQKLSRPEVKDYERSRELDGQGRLERRRQSLEVGDRRRPHFLDLKDQEGVSTDRTLRKLQRKMRRLKLLNMCCQGGVGAGRQVYGHIDQVTEECRHGSFKYVRDLNPEFGYRKCAKQFMDCCLEEAKKGVPMTREEFYDDTISYNWDHGQHLDPRLVSSVLSQRGRLTSPPEKRYHVTTPATERPRGSNQRRYLFQTSNAKGQGTASSRITPDSGHEHPATTPNSKFPQHGLNTNVVNQVSKDLKDTPELPSTTGTRSPFQREVSRHSDNRLEKQKGDNIPKQTKTRTVYVDIEDPSTNANKEAARLSREDDIDKRFESMRREIKEEDLYDGFYGPRKFDDVDNFDDNDDGGDEEDESIDDAKDDDDDDDDDDNEDVGKEFEKDDVNILSDKYDGIKNDNFDDSIKGKIITREENVQTIGDETEDDEDNNKFITISHHRQSKDNSDKFSPAQRKDDNRLFKPDSGTKFVLPNEGANAKQGGESKRHRKNKEKKHKLRKQSNKRHGHQSFSDSPFKHGALDSRELAERNARKYYRNALDSREMADQYVGKPNSFHNRKYRYFTPTRRRY